MYVDISMSLDGYVAGPDADLENPLGVGGMQLHAEGWWGEEPPFKVPVFVVTHHAREKDVLIAGGADVVQQALTAGLVDEVQVHVAPVFLGSGVRLFDNLGDDVKVEPARVIESPNVTHLRYRVVKS